ncbi:MAG: hypothetical protein WBI43_02120 [Bacillota bacterium]
MAENREYKQDMTAHTKNHSQVSHKDIEVLAALLVAFPQISKVTYDPEKRGLSISFLCEGPVSKTKRHRLKSLYLDAIEVYRQLTDKNMSLVRCYWETIDQFHCFHVERDVASLSTGELNLTVSLIADQVPLVAETAEPFVTDGEFSWSARMLLQEMLERIRELKCQSKLVALREGEKVIVFHK